MKATTRSMSSLALSHSGFSKKNTCPSPSDSSHEALPRHALAVTAALYARPRAPAQSFSPVQTSILSHLRFSSLGEPGAVGFILGSSTPPTAVGHANSQITAMSLAVASGSPSTSVFPPNQGCR
uniref:Uncharacterized protein n=1 Tax=Oryza brachyantha TaxID=4533 RepID=J3MY72_ORYBR